MEGRLGGIPCAGLAALEKGGNPKNPEKEKE
jgi:hypothetical protein